MLAVCSHLHWQPQHSSVYATWGAPAHSVAVAVAAELVPIAGLLAAQRSVLGLHLVLVLMPVLDLARELGPEPEPEPEPELEPELGLEPAPARDVAARRTFVVVFVPALLPLFDVHRLSNFDPEFVPPVPPPCTYWALQKLVDLSFVEGIRDGVAGFGVGAEAALAEAGQRAARADVENCWAQRLPSRAKRAKAQHGETKLGH